MKIENLKKYLFLLPVAVLLVSCFKNEETPLEVNVDAFTIKKMSGEQPVYGVSFYAYGNQVLKSGTVTKMGGLQEQVNLQEYSLYTLAKNPVNDDFKPYPPENGEYKFSIIAESGATKDISDFLKIKNLAIPTIIGVTPNDIQKLITVTWNPVTGASVYVVKVADAKGNYLFSSPVLNSDTKAYTINLLTGNWSNPVESGNSYIIELNAYAFEDGVDSQESAYNVETISVASRTINI